MPLYKITSKRLARKEREDASGLTELKAKIFEELGEDDGSSGSGSGSDSEGSSGSDEDEDEDEESGSGSGSEGSEGTVDSEESSDDEEDDDEDDADTEDAESTLPIGSKRKRPQGPSDGEEEDEEEESASGNEDESASEDDDADEEDDADADADTDADVPFTLTLDTALISPIYPAPRSAGAGPDGRLCVLCPGKVLKHERMVQVHLSSSSHTRALKRYQSRLSSLTTDPLSTEDPREVVQAIVSQLEEKRAGEGKRADRKPRESKKSERRAVLREKKAARRALKAGREAARRAEAESAQGNNGETEHSSGAGKAGVSDGAGTIPAGSLKSQGKDAATHGDGDGDGDGDASASAGVKARAAKRLKKEVLRLDAASHGHRRAPRTIRKEARAQRLLAEAVERGEVVPGSGPGMGFEGTVASTGGGGGGGFAPDVAGSGSVRVGDGNGEQLEGWNRMARRMAQKQGIHLGHSGSGWGSKVNAMPLGVARQVKGQGQAHGAHGAHGSAAGLGPGTKRAKKEHKREVKAKREERKVERRRKLKAEKERGVGTATAAATATATA